MTLTTKTSLLLIIWDPQSIDIISIHQYGSNKKNLQDETIERKSHVDEKLQKMSDQHIIHFELLESMSAHTN